MDCIDANENVEVGDNVERCRSDVADRANAPQASPNASVQSQNAGQADLPPVSAQLIQPGLEPTFSGSRRSFYNIQSAL